MKLWTLKQFVFYDIIVLCQTNILLTVKVANDNKITTRTWKPSKIACQNVSCSFLLVAEHF